MERRSVTTAAVVVLALLVAAVGVPRLGGSVELVGPDVVAQYEVVDARLGERTFRRDGPTELDPDDAVTHTALFAEWIALVPPYWARRVEAFAIASDGAGGTAAYVQRRDPEGERWLMAVDPVDAVERPDDYAYTLVHELAHVVTLGAGRVVAEPGRADLVARTAACGGPATVEGCATPGSTTAAFVERFWDEADLAAADRLRAATDREGATVARHRAAPGEHVSPYAATDPGEDLAETFTALALSLPVPPGSVAAEKVALLAADPELFALAERVRSLHRDR